MAVIGKTGVEKGERIIWDGDDLSADLVPGTIGPIGLDSDEADMHGVSETVKHSLPVWASSTVSAQFIMNDNQTAGVYDRSYLLTRDLKTIGTLTWQLGLAGAAPGSGNPEFEGTYELMKASVGFDGGRAVINAEWEVSGSSSPAWGTVA